MLVRRHLVDVPRGPRHAIARLPGRPASALKTASGGLHLVRPRRAWSTASQAPDASGKNRSGRPWSRRGAVLPQNDDVVVTGKRPPKSVDWSKLGHCLGSSALNHYGLGGLLNGATAASTALAVPIPKAIVPPYRVIGSKTTNLLSVLGHYADITVPGVEIAGRYSTNLLRIAGRINPIVSAGLLAVDAAVIGYNTYQCYAGQ